MRNIGRILKRDTKRLLRVPKAWIIVIGVIFTPALYAWFNVVAFWDPYSQTGNIKIDVVNQDRGGSTELTGHVDAGAMVEQQLRENDQLGWTFTTKEEALENVRDGSVYAAIIIPPDFTEDLLSITTGHFTAPKLYYYVNEKTNAVAPKMTDAGATELDRRISAAFVEQVANAAAGKVQELAEDTDSALSESKTKTLNAFDQASTAVAEIRTDVSELNDKLDEARTNIAGTSDTLEDVKGTLQDVQVSLASAQDLVAEAQKEVLAFVTSISTAYTDGVTGVADAAASANAAVSKFTGTLTQVNTDIEAAITQAEQTISATTEAIGKIQDALAQTNLPDDIKTQLETALSALESKAAADQQILTDLKSLNTDATAALGSLNGTAKALSDAANNAQKAAAGMNDSLRTSVPALSSALATLSGQAGAFSATLDTQISSLSQAQSLIQSLDGQLLSTSNALLSLDLNLNGIADGLQTARTDISALGTAAAWVKLREVADIDPSAIAQFVASPVEVNENVIFPVATYGSGMAALFTNLSLWIGAFVLMVIFKLEVDEEGAPSTTTVRQAYLARFLFLAVIVALQALVVCVGDLIVGVQTVSALAFVITGILVGLAYLSIIYALSVSLGHIGRGLCVLLVIMQIPGASGLYPIEMMPGFFRSIYPFLPFTYGIDAMRETIAGFYQNAYWMNLGVLCIFVAFSFILGLSLRRYLADLNLIFNKQIGATGLLISENVEVVGSQYRIRDGLRALFAGQAYQGKLRHRAAAFKRKYQVLLGSAIVVGVVGLVVLGFIAWLLPGGRATLLIVWVIWCLLIMGFLVGLEYVKQRLQLASEVEEMPKEAILRHVAAKVASETGPAHSVNAAHEENPAHNVNADHEGNEAQ